MSDGVTYERANIEDWISTHDNLSPISQQPFTGTPIINRVVRNLIESSIVTLSPQPVLRIRLRISMQWLVQSKCPLTTFESAYEDFSKRRFKDQDPWPLSADPDACVDLTWAHCPLLRFMVYKEFANAAGEGQNASDYTKQLAARWFVGSMKNPHLRSKTDQLVSALASAYQAVFDASSISAEWKNFWGDSRSSRNFDDLPSQQSRSQRNDLYNLPTYIHDLSRPHHESGSYNDWYRPQQSTTDMSTPHSASGHSQSRPQQDYDTQWDAYAAYGTGGLHRFGHS